MLTFLKPKYILQLTQNRFEEMVGELVWRIEEPSIFTPQATRQHLTFFKQQHPVLIPRLNAV